MKQKIKDFLLKRRLKKVLKNKKGFSLIEVLVAVGIIAIISAIAVPQFTANRNEAAKVAGDTSVSNILKAFSACRVLKSFTECDTLGEIGINCPDCHNDTATTSPNKFCAHIAKGDANNPDFAACVSIEETGSGNSIGRTYGGSLLSNTKVCQTRCSGCNTATNNKDTSVSPVVTCNLPGDCTAGSCPSGDGCNAPAAVCEPAGTGKCDGSNNCS